MSAPSSTPPPVTLPSVDIATAPGSAPLSKVVLREGAGPLPVRDIVLFESTRLRDAARYEVLARYPLR